MSCVATAPTFRLLDRFVGWDPADHTNLTGLDEPVGLHLALLPGLAGTATESELAAYLLPARLARGCGPCEWYLVTPAPPQSRLLYRNACHTDWQPLWHGKCAENPLLDAVAVAARGDRLAVSDRGRGRVFRWNGKGGRLTAAIPVPAPGPLAFCCKDESLVAVEGADYLWRFDLVGRRLADFPAPLPEGAVERLATDEEGTLWLVTLDANQRLRLWRTNDDRSAFVQATLSELAAAFPETGIAGVSKRGFCLRETGSDGAQTLRCYSWYGRPLTRDQVLAPPPPRFLELGQLLTQPIDSGIPRCRWHRVRLEADVPPGTTLAVTVSTIEDPDDPNLIPQGANRAPWEAFAAGVPHPDDWQEVPSGSRDFLIDQPPGRYLFLRLRLTGNGFATPYLRRIRLDFPRITSLERLPSVYREAPEAEDFSERFLSLFDAAIEDLDRGIERFPALLDSDGVPEAVLPWIAGFLDIVLDPAWDIQRRRAIIAAAPSLYKKRGTPAGLRQAINLVFGVEPVLRELGPERTWSALGRNSRLRALRLFSRSRGRFRLGQSALSGAPLRGYGNPDLDPFTAGAYRLQVLVPPGAALGNDGPRRLAQLVERQKPAHTIAAIHLGGTAAWIAGTASHLGIDTQFIAPPPPVLGASGNVRLNRASLLVAGKTHRCGIATGQTSVVPTAPLTA